MITPTQSKLIEAQLAPAAVKSQIDASLAAKSLNVQKQQGAAILKLLDNATIAPQPPRPRQTIPPFPHPQREPHLPPRRLTPSHLSPC